MYSMRLFLALALLLLTFGCSREHPPTANNATSTDAVALLAPGSMGEGAAFIRSGFDVQGQEVQPAGISLQALLLAQWLADEMYPPLPLARELDRELDIIYRQWSDRIDIKGIPFFPPYELAMILVGFTEEGWQMFKDGEYHHWDALNEQFDLDTMTLWSGGAAEYFKNVELHFNGLPNANHLVDYYAGLPEVEYVEVNAYCCDWSILLVYQGDEGRHYFFRNAWGDCPSGCIEQEYYYIFVTGDVASYGGYYKFDWSNPQLRPDWMWMVDEALDRYWEQNYWP